MWLNAATFQFHFIKERIFQNVMSLSIEWKILKTYHLVPCKIASFSYTLYSLTIQNVWECGRHLSLYKNAFDALFRLDLSTFRSRAYISFSVCFYSISIKFVVFRHLEVPLDIFGLLSCQAKIHFSLVITSQMLSEQRKRLQVGTLL